MTRQTHIIQPIPQLPVSRRGVKRWWLSAVVYLTLCVWMGPHAAFWLTAIAAFIAGWVWLAHRFPTFGYFTFVFLDGFISGLIGYRSRYYRPRYRR